MTFPSPLDVDPLAPEPGAVIVSPPAALPVPPARTVSFPLSWIMQRAPGPIQYRAMREVVRLSPMPPSTSALVYGAKPALLLAIRLVPDGSWNSRMLQVPVGDSSDLGAVGTIHAARRLLEWGWERESPPLLLARRLLFRLLAEDAEPSYLFELADDATDGDLVRRGRLILREAAAGVLAQAGYESDPRLRGCAHRMLARVGEFLASPLAEKPWVRVGNKHLLSAEAQPPSIHLLHMLAFMPHFQLEQSEFMDHLFTYLTRALPRQEPLQQVGAQVRLQPHLVLGDPLATRSVADADVPFALYWLELMARLGLLARHEGWMRLYERFLGDCDRDGVWRPGRGKEVLATDSSITWGQYPLHSTPSGDGVAADVTFRLGLIARLSEREIEVV